MERDVVSFGDQQRRDNDTSKAKTATANKKSEDGQRTIQHLNSRLRT